MPGTDDLLGRVAIEIQSVEADTFAASVASTVPLSILVKVTSHQERPRIRVEARRFYVEADKTTKVSPRTASGKEPELPSGYLRAGDSMSGWLTFEVPKAAKQLVLKCDMRRPPLEVPIAFSGSPGGK